MDITVEGLEGGYQCIHLAGRLDMKGTQEVELKFTGFAAAGKKSVLVDLSKVEFIASIGIRLLLSNIKALSASKARLVLLKPSKMVEDVLKMAGLDSYAPIFHDMPSAVEALKQTAA